MGVSLLFHEARRMWYISYDNHCGLNRKLQKILGILFSQVGFVLMDHVMQGMVLVV